ncbi:hypothetical protein OROHE_008540 [Orobanche hederae]
MILKYPERRNTTIHINLLKAFLVATNGTVRKLSEHLIRQQVSEGIDFSYENARVSKKKKLNDTYKSSKGLLSGNEWYCQQAFRALNQAAELWSMPERDGISVGSISEPVT